LKTVTGLYESGNWREIQEVDDHNVHAIYREQDSGVIAGPVKFFQKALTKILEWLNSQM